MSQFSLNFLPERQVWSVSEINAALRAALEQEFSDVWVEGEISNLKLAPSGHYYFTLKDAQAQLRCVFFKQNARYLKFRPADGLAVLARGRMTVYEVRGEYQLVVETLEARGAGALQLAFEQLKKKLAAEGLFDQARKRPLPLLPRRIGIVTSPRGAVIADMVRVLGRRFPGLHLRLYPVPVQGETAAPAICEALDYFGRRRWADLVIVGRGGGSLEDLWPFNEESVARAIAGCPVPVISAVGHETDFTIADFVADLRAPTPSAAAELAVRTREEFEERIAGGEERLGRAVRYRLAVALRRLTELGIERPLGVVRRRMGRAGQRTDELDYQLRDAMRRRLREAERRLGAAATRLGAQEPRVELAARRARLDQFAGALGSSLRRRLWEAERRLGAATTRLWGRDPQVEMAARRARLDKLAGALELSLRRSLEKRGGRVESLRAQLGHLNPLAVLERGYALVQDEQGRLLRRAADTAVGERLRVRLGQGRLGVDVREVE